MSKTTKILAVLSLSVIVLVSVVGLALAASSKTSAGDAVRGYCRGAAGTVKENVAKLLGLTTDQVIAEREKGKSFADIAKDKGVSADKLTDVIIDSRKDSIEQRVKDGTLTRERADAIIARMTERIKERVTAQNSGCSSTEACLGQGQNRKASGGPVGGAGCGMKGGRGANAGACDGECTNQ